MPLSNLGLILLDTMSPTAKTSVKMEYAALAAGCTNRANLDKIRSKIETEYDRRTATKRGTGSFPVMTDAAEAKLRKRIKGLEARLDKPTKATKGPPSPCKICADDKQTVNGGKPGMHWHSECPLRGRARKQPTAKPAADDSDSD